MSDKPMVYLAGPIKNLSYSEATGWRDEVAKVLEDTGVAALSPMRDKQYLKWEEYLTDHYEQHPLSTRRGITTRDRFDVTRCDILFVNLLGAKKVSIGTVMEIARADLMRTPIVMVMEEDNIHQHGMLQEVTGYIVPDLKQGVRPECGNEGVIVNTNDNYWVTECSCHDTPIFEDPFDAWKAWEKYCKKGK